MAENTKVEKEKILVTSALPYVNNVPHLGNIIGCVLSADVFARFCRLDGKEVLYVCGTDEHGTTTEAKAVEEGLTPREICDKYYELHKQIYEWFDCSFDCFGRTSNELHKKTTQEIFKKIYDNGFIKEQVLEQTFCEHCDTFLADRFVEGKCPHCGYEDARGDQCDKCGRMLNSADLINPKCKRCGNSPIIKESDHLFLDLPKLVPKLKEWFDKQSLEGFWTNNAIRETASWFKEGIKERCISRDLKWGVPIPLEGYEDKVFYVWFDAPIGYISITQESREDWESWWKDDNVKLFQFMAKDNVPFHSIIFPSMMIASEEGFIKVHHLNATEYLNYESGKFSKSRNVGVFGNDAMESGIPSDVWRYYLLSNRPENADAEFNWKDFQDRNNNELLANLGNFINRTLVFIKRNFEGKIHRIADDSFTDADNNVIEDSKRTFEEVKSHLEKVSLREALKKVMHLSRLGNQYFQEQTPWVLVKEDPERAKAVMNVCANLAYNTALALAPFLPKISKEICIQLNADHDEKSDAFEFKRLFNDKEHGIGEPKVLFRKLEDKEIEGFRKRFQGEKQMSLRDLDLRTAQIMSVQEHPKADKLYVMKIMCQGEKQLVAGLRPYYPKEELEGKNIVIVNNLEPAKLRGEVSEGMLLAVENKEGVVGVLTHDESPGKRVLANSNEKLATSLISIAEFAKIPLEYKEGKLLNNEKEFKVNNKSLISDKNIDGKVR